MRPVRLTPHIYQLTRFRFVNAYLVVEDDGLTLIDTMLSAADGVAGAAAELNAPIRRIALTHGHADHIGSLDGLTQRLAEPPEVLLGDLDARVIAGEDPGGKKPPGSWPKQLKTHIDTRLTGGERIGSLEVFPSPGHTPGHVAFLDTRDRALIAGDVFTNIGELSVSDHFYWRFPLATMGTWDRTRDLESARTLRSLRPSLLAVGHGPALADPAAAMDRAVARTDQP